MGRLAPGVDPAQCCQGISTIHETEVATCSLNDACPRPTNFHPRGFDFCQSDGCQLCPSGPTWLE